MYIGTSYLHICLCLFVCVLTCKRAHMPQHFEHRTQTPQLRSGHQTRTTAGSAHSDNRQYSGHLEQSKNHIKYLRFVGDVTTHYDTLAVALKYAISVWVRIDHFPDPTTTSSFFPVFCYITELILVAQKDYNFTTWNHIHAS